MVAGFRLLMQISQSQPLPDGDRIEPMLRADLTTPGTEIDVEIFGKRCKATVQPDQPLWDPANERIRA